jgi:hypothetical protein
MLITPYQVKDYTEFETVKNRPDSKIEKDILQAQTEIFQYVGHKFNDLFEYPQVPAEVDLALIKLAEYYALVNSDESIVKGYQSERLGDYSYTLSSGQVINKPSISALLAAFIKSSGAAEGKVRFRMGAI